MSNDVKKFLDEEGVKVLWNQVNLNDYPNNETLIAVINAIDETKANKDEIPTLTSQLENDSGFMDEDQVKNLFKSLSSNLVLSFYCVEDVTIITNGVSVIYPANSNVEVSFLDTDIWEIVTTSDNSILALNSFPGALGTFYPWLEGVKQFSNILFDMNNVDFYSKWSQGNQGMYQVQFAQYVNCIFWSDNAYVSDVNKRTNYTLYYSSQLPLCYSNIPDNTFKAFFLAFGVNNDPNWGNPAYRDSFAKATWATQAFSYYGARTIGMFGHDSELFNIVLPKDCRGLFCESTAVENAGTFDAINVTNFGAKSGSWRDAFRMCSSLKNLYIKNLKVNLNVSWSPINYNSIYYIISEAANTNAITISVSPYTYYLLDTSDFELAASKNITIELLTTNYVEDKRLSEIANKADKSDVPTNLLNGNSEGSLRGINTLAEDDSYTMGVNAFAIGNGTKASGKNSFASGQGVEATNSYTHAEGLGSIAKAAGAHAEGNYTLASSQYQHTAGQYNIEDAANVYAHIIGNGTSATRKNIHTIAWTGDGWFSGDVYVGSTGGLNKDEGSKKLATEEYIDIRVPAWTVEDEGKILKIINNTPVWVSSESKIIKFYINEFEYEAEEGMKWKYWPTSRYNFDTYYKYDKRLNRISDADNHIGLNGDFIKGEDIITANCYYEVIMDNSQDI